MGLKFRLSKLVLPKYVDSEHGNNRVWQQFYLRILWHFSILKEMCKYSFLITLTTLFSIPDSFILSLFYNLTVLGAWL